MVFGSLTCHHITLTRVFLIQNDPSKKPADFCTRPRAIHWLSWPKPRFISRPKIKQSVVRFSVWFSHISSPSLSLFHALSTLPVSSHTHASIGSLEQEDFHHICLYKKQTKKKTTWIYRLKYDRFGRKILLTPTQRTISWERLRLFFFFPLPVHPRWQDGRKKGGKEVEKRERNSSYTILPIGRLYDAHLQPRGSMPHVCTVYFGLHWSFKLCYAIYRRTAHAI